MKTDEGWLVRGFAMTILIVIHMLWQLYAESTTLTTILYAATLVG